MLDDDDDIGQEGAWRGQRKLVMVRSAIDLPRSSRGSKQVISRCEGSTQDFTLILGYLLTARYDNPFETEFEFTNYSQLTSCYNCMYAMEFSVYN